MGIGEVFVGYPYLVSQEVKPLTPKEGETTKTPTVKTPPL